MEIGHSYTRKLPSSSPRQPVSNRSDLPDQSRNARIADGDSAKPLATTPAPTVRVAASQPRLCAPESLARSRMGPLHTRLVRWDHVLDVDERVHAAALLEQVERLLDELPDVPEVALRLAVVDAIAEVQLLRLVQVEHREQLAVVRHEGLSDGRAVGVRGPGAVLHQHLQTV